MLGGCEYHAITREQVRERWDKASVATVEDGKSITVCACCDAPALSEARHAADESGRPLPGGVCDPTRCSRCAVVDEAQEAAIMARLRAGYSEVASGV